MQREKVDFELNARRAYTAVKRSRQWSVMMSTSLSRDGVAG